MSSPCWEYRKYKPVQMPSRRLNFADDDLSTAEYLAKVNRLIRRHRHSHPLPALGVKGVRR